MLWIISKQNLLRQVYKRMEQRCAQLGRLSEDWLRDYRLKLTFASVRILQTEKESFCFENLFQTAQVYFDWLG